MKEIKNNPIDAHVANFMVQELRQTQKNGLMCWKKIIPMQSRLDVCISGAIPVLQNGALSNWQMSYERISCPLVLEQLSSIGTLSHPLWMA